MGKQVEEEEGNLEMVVYLATDRKTPNSTTVLSDAG
jgi:hypothetical protein